MPGSYRVVIDAYPNLPGGQRNFQLFRTIRVAGAYKPEPLPAFRPSPCSTWRWASRSYHLSETTPGLYAHSAPALVMVGHWGLSFEIQPPGKQPRPPGSSSPCSLATSSGNRFT